MRYLIKKPSLNEPEPIIRGCRYGNRFLVAFSLNRESKYYFLAFMNEMFPRLGEI